MRAKDFGLEEGAGGGGAGEDDFAIDFGGVVFGAGGVRGFDEDAEGFSSLGFGDFAGDFLLEGHGLAMAAMSSSLQCAGWV